MKEFILRNLSVILFTAILFILTPIVSVTTREFGLSFDPVLILWSVIFMVFALNQFKSGLSVLVLSGPLLITAMLPMFGFEGIRDNPNNPNLLDANYYRMIGLYLIIGITVLTKIKRSS